MNQRILTVAFLRPVAEDHWVNRLTGRVSRHPFCHAELFFESLNLCFSIVWGETAGFRFKNLSNPNYSLVSLGVSSQEYDSCLEYCRSSSNHMLQFDDRGMWRSWFPSCLSCTMCDGSSQQRGVTFCSKVITEALQFAGVGETHALLPAATTPSSLYQVLHASPRVICSGVPYKRQAMQNLVTGCPLSTIRML